MSEVLPVLVASLKMLEPFPREEYIQSLLHTTWGGLGAAYEALEHAKTLTRMTRQFAPGFSELRLKQRRLSAEFEHAMYAGRVDMWVNLEQPDQTFASDSLALAMVLPLSDFREMLSVGGVTNQPVHRPLVAWGKELHAACHELVAVDHMVSVIARKFSRKPATVLASVYDGYTTAFCGPHGDLIPTTHDEPGFSYSLIKSRHLDKEFSPDSQRIIRMLLDRSAMGVRTTSGPDVCRPTDWTVTYRVT